MKLSVRLAAKAPFCLFQAMFIMWTFSGLLRTLAYLAEKGDELKYSIMRCFGFWIVLYFSVLLLVSTAFVTIHIAVDAEWVWKTVFIFEIIWFSTFSMTLFAIALIFRPNEDSKILATVNEFLDETLTEVDEIGAKNGRREIEMGVGPFFNIEEESSGNSKSISNKASPPGNRDRAE